VESVGTSTPVEDFEALVAEGAVEEAVAGMRQAIVELVEKSLGDR
jgi:hypothetical protein